MAPKISPNPKPPAFSNTLGLMAGKQSAMQAPQALGKKERLQRSLMGPKVHAGKGMKPASKAATEGQRGF